MNNPSNTPSTPPQAPAPAPLDIAKTIKTGWTVLGVGILAILVGLFYGYALVIAALLCAFAGRLGLQTKNKALAITALIFCGVSLVLFALTVAINR